MQEAVKWQFWKWFFRGIPGEKPGFLNLFGIWVILHICIGFFLSMAINLPLQEAARTILLPLAGIFIGLCFAWAGNAQALLQSKEIEELSRYASGGIQTYVYTYQTAVLILLVTLCTWGLAGLGLFSHPTLTNTYVVYGLEAGLYFLASLAIRECWHVVLGSQAMILMRYNIKKIKSENEDSRQ